ncbi:WW domain-binding protein 11-like [Bos javanicus]|uniref:WW domain-binding protein 11-like n=1 Tax=Bos javanicus TaxID=9906 RepID=UPI002AA8DF48|nr:WW domain-binding protein 11-like [Bos javanicus]
MEVFPRGRNLSPKRNQLVTLNCQKQECPQEKEEILFHGGATQAGGPSESAGSKKSSFKKFQQLSQEDRNGYLPGNELLKGQFPVLHYTQSLAQCPEVNSCSDGSQIGIRLPEDDHFTSVTSLSTDFSPSPLPSRATTKEAEVINERSGTGFSKLYYHSDKHPTFQEKQEFYFRQTKRKGDTLSKTPQKESHFHAEQKSALPCKCQHLLDNSTLGALTPLSRPPRACRPAGEPPGGPRRIRPSSAAVPPGGPEGREGARGGPGCGGRGQGAAATGPAGPRPNRHPQPPPLHTPTPARAGRAARPASAPAGPLAGGPPSLPVGAPQAPESPAPATPAPALSPFHSLPGAWRGPANPRPHIRVRGAGNGLGSSAAAATAPPWAPARAFPCQARGPRRQGCRGCTRRGSSLLQHHYRHCEDITPESRSSALRNDNFPTILEAEQRGARGKSAPAPDKVQISASHLWKKVHTGRLHRRLGEKAGKKLGVPQKRLRLLQGGKCFCIF